MIENQLQYGVTKEQISRLTGALEGAREGEGRMDPRVYRAMIAGIESLIEEMRQELREYEDLQKATGLHVPRAEELPEALIKARVARGYTQKELAERLGLKPQQIQRYEATGYRSASLKRLLEIMKALDLDFEVDIPLRPGPGKSPTEVTAVSVSDQAEPYARKRRAAQKGRSG